MSQVNPTPVPTPTPTLPLLSKEEAQLRTDLYTQQRINYQADFYQRRIEEFNFNADRMLWISAGLMGLSTVFSSLAFAADKTWMAYLTALLPAFAAAVAAFRTLYQWERQASIYEGTWLALQQARLAMPDESFLRQDDYPVYFPLLVTQAEEVLRKEASQWGQVESVEMKPGQQPAPPTLPPTPAGGGDTPPPND